MQNAVVDRTRTKLWPAAIALTLVCSLAIAAGNPPELPNPGNPGMSRQNQIQLGFQAAAQVYKGAPVLPDSSQETQYVRQLGEKLAATIPQQYTWPYQFHVIAQKEINAFALPGGPMFINLGTLTAADNEAQLAGVMAHEMAHVYMQHSARQMAKARKTGLLAGLAGIVASAALGGAAGDLAQQGIHMSAQSLMLKYSRADEAQADEVGAIILWKAGYNPQALADFFKKLDQQGGGAGPQFLSDHPNPGNREAAIKKEIAKWPHEQYQASSAAFAQAKEHAAGVRSYSAKEITQGAKSGEWARLNEQNGAVFQAPPGVTIKETAAASPAPSAGPVDLSRVLPSARMMTANLGGLTIDYPENWLIFRPRRQGEGVTIAPRAGVIGGGIGYGVVISSITPKPGRPLDLDRVTGAFMRQFAADGARAVESPQPFRVAGVVGRSVALQSTSPFPDANGQQQLERDWLVTVPTPDGAVAACVFVAPQAQFDRFLPTYQNMLRGLHF